MQRSRPLVLIECKQLTGFQLRNFPQGFVNLAGYSSGQDSQHGHNPLGIRLGTLYGVGKEVNTNEYSTKTKIGEHFLRSIVIVVSHEERAREDNIAESYCTKPW